MVGVTCANGNVFVATSKGFLIRYHWDEYGGEKVISVIGGVTTPRYIRAAFLICMRLA